MQNKEQVPIDIDLSKFDLGDNDVLVIKVKNEIVGDELIKVLTEIKDDPVIKTLIENGKKVFYTYSGIDLSILRMEEKDKLLIYMDVSPFENEEDKTSYVDLIKGKIQTQISNEVVVVPIDLAAVKGVVQKDGEAGEISEGVEV